MIFDLKDLEVEIIKKFNGEFNYYNPSHFNGKTIFRRQTKYQDKILISDIVDEDDNVILQHKLCDEFITGYEDARFINDEEISVCVCQNDKDDLNRHINVKFAKYNLKSKELKIFKTQNAHFEKHWQFYDDKIIYHINPYTILDFDENVIFKKEINWEPWIKKYGNPRLSTNVFEVGGIKYLLFHSSKNINGVNLRYYVGIMILDSSLNPIGYCDTTLFNSTESFDIHTFFDYFSWKRKLLGLPTIVDIIFPMNVCVDTYINIYCGINDCISANIKINKNEFINKIKKSSFILV